MSMLDKLSAGITRISTGKVDTTAPEPIDLAKLVQRLSPQVRMDLHTALLTQPVTESEVYDSLPPSFTETDPIRAEAFFDNLKNNFVSYFRKLRELVCEKLPSALNLDDFIVMVAEGKYKFSKIQDKVLEKLLQDKHDESKISSFLNSIQLYCANKLHRFVEQISQKDSIDITKECSSIADSLRNELRPFLTKLLDKAVIADRAEIVKLLVHSRFGVLYTDFSKPDSGLSQIPIYQITDLDKARARELAEEHNSTNTLNFLNNIDN
jgi:hypothetical protein